MLITRFSTRIKVLFITSLSVISSQSLIGQDTIHVSEDHLSDLVTHSEESKFKAPTESSNHDLNLGLEHAGGIIFSIDSKEPHGLTVKKQALSSTMSWNDRSEHLGIGECASKACEKLVHAGYNDWYLPTIEDLETMHANGQLDNVQNLSGSLIWSSTIDPESKFVWAFDLHAGQRILIIPDHPCNVLAIRRF